MTREEAERAAATFSVPGWHVEAVHSQDDYWVLHAWKINGGPFFPWREVFYLPTIADCAAWLLRTQHEATERSASDGAMERDATTDADTGGVR